MGAKTMVRGEDFATFKSVEERQLDRLMVWCESILREAGFRDFVLVPQKLVADPDNEDRKKVASSPKYKDWRTNPPPMQWPGANAFLLRTGEPWHVDDADSPETSAFEKYLVATGWLPKPRLVVESRPGRQHRYWPKLGSWTFNRRFSGIDFIDLSISGVYAPGSHHPVSGKPYRVLEVNPGSPPLDEDTFREALFGEGLREYNGFRKAAGLKPVQPGHRSVGATTDKPSSLNGPHRKRKTRDSGRLDRNATLFGLAHDLWYEKGVRDRNAILAKLLRRNRQPYPDANHDEPLPEDRVRGIAESVGYGNGTIADDGFRQRQRARGRASGRSRRKEGATEAKRMSAVALRKDGLLQVEIGRKIGLSQQYVSTLLKGMPRGVNDANHHNTHCSYGSGVEEADAFTLSDTEKRRRRVKKQHARRLKKTRMAALCGVSRQTIYNDIDWLEKHPDAFRKPKPTRAKKRRRTAKERRVEELTPVWGETAEFVYGIEVQLKKDERSRRRKQRKMEEWFSDLPNRASQYVYNMGIIESEPTGGQRDAMNRMLAKGENATLRAEIRYGLDDGWNTQWKWGWTEEERERLSAGFKKGVASACDALSVGQGMNHS